MKRCPYILRIIDSIPHNLRTHHATIRSMDSLNRHIQQFMTNSRNRPTSERAHLIQTVCDTLFDDTHFKKILGQTKQFTVEEIRDIFTQAKSWQVNPKALFWKLIREKQQEIKTQIAKTKQTQTK
ncbi:MAG: hypothetical protein OXB96_02520 [Candidatus Kaiserbacteria bacterium]|nr:hypothetical protein [Candidatus Kaiserbacteria bacterium]